MCAMAKRMKVMDIPDVPDLFVLEFAVNDYQGQDHILYVEEKMDVFYDGFERLALCCEVVVSYLLRTYPNTPIIFLEFQTTILNRKNAQLLHTGVAQYYQIPIISYGDVMLPHYYQLISHLNASTYYTTSNDEMILPFPHGCHTSCNKTLMHPVFHKQGCMTVCHFMQKSKKDCRVGQHDRFIQNSTHQPCYLHYLAHDAVHPSPMGHQIARDLIIELFATTIRDVCLDHHHHNNTNNRIISDHDDHMKTNNTLITHEQQQEQQQRRHEVSYQHIIPPEPYGWLTSVDVLRRHSDFVLVQDTFLIFEKQDSLESYNYSTGFGLYQDGRAGRIGWISTNPNGNEYIEFVIHLPKERCYVVYVSILKSYENMGMMTIKLINFDDDDDDHTNPNHDQNNKKNHSIRSVVVDGLWQPRISVPVDIQLNHDDDHDACTGHCIIRIITHPQRPNDPINATNKVKITSLSARHCIT